jgi:uncharacterized membrane protein YvbJ
MKSVAEDSSMLYICGKCKSIVEKNATVCNKCGARLGKIRCPFCNFTGDLNDFKYDTCPKCGKKNKIKRIDSKKINNGNININNKSFSISKKLFLILALLLFFSILILSFIFILYYKLL